MKNTNVIKVCLALFMLFTFEKISSQSTQIVIGQVKNGTAVITDLTKATNLLKSNLSVTAVLSDIKLEYSEFDGTYYLTAKVSNDLISYIGVQLGQNNASLYSGPGVGVEVTCTGRNCTDCRLIISKWRPKCRCEEPTASDYACDMMQRAVVNIGVN